MPEAFPLIMIIVFFSAVALGLLAKMIAMCIKELQERRFNERHQREKYFFRIQHTVDSYRGILDYPPYLCQNDPDLMEERKEAIKNLDKYEEELAKLKKEKYIHQLLVQMKQA